MGIKRLRGLKKTRLYSLLKPMHLTVMVTTLYTGRTVVDLRKRITFRLRPFLFQVHLSADTLWYVVQH